MFKCEVETMYTDPMKVHDELPKHEAAARSKLGECWMKGSMTTSIPIVNDAGVPTDNHDYKLTTYWEVGVRPGSEAEPQSPPAPRREGE